ncbi:TonB-dependent receptor [Moheibacter stercoris]|uniref:Iron complex outermembrane receptor protein n=1 Tax=Moheibacter stercoris TaxID=1628251 RepID=A0ABV2LTH0_9FLAO
MKSRIFLCAVLSGTLAYAQVEENQDSTIIELEGLNLVEQLPITSEKITKKLLNQKNLGQDIPSLLQNATSVVTTSDAGAGIGYSTIRIRGIGQEHINITMNGVTLNDPESQGVFWVNMPDLASNANSIMIQRGVGTSTSGTGAFGAIINMDSSNPSPKAFLESSNSWGSFATQKYSLNGGTGSILNNKLRIDLNASLIQSDGYIDRAFSDLFSYGMNAKYELNENTSFRYWTFFGKEKTYQSWNGIDAETMKSNRRFNSAGAIYNEDWTDIVGYYDNETDNYQQHHNHFIWEQKYGKGWKSTSTLHYTIGKGYYENYKQGADLVEYKIISDLETSDLVRQKWLDNHFYGINFQMENQTFGDIKLFTGFAANQFQNDHYGIVNWVKDLDNVDPKHEFYRNESQKTDISAYAKALWSLNRWELFGDIQYRYVNYQTKFGPNGENEFEDFFPFEGDFHFINPKLGFNFAFNNQNHLYFYYGMTHREPNRSDYLDNKETPKTEKLHDFEFGFKKSGRLQLNANAFYMYYIDQLVPTGELDDVGGFKRTNSGESFRSGIELQANYTLIPQKLDVFANGTFSIHQNLDYSEIAYDENWNELLVHHGKTAIAFSPNIIGAFGLNYSPFKNFNLNLSNKYVGEQFLTNTELENGKLDDYFLTDLLFQYSPKWLGLENLRFSLLINNLFDVEYESNGYYYEQAFYFPQAGINILGGVQFRL